MSFTRYFSLILLSFLMMLCQSATSSVAKGQCGQYYFQIKAINGEDISERQFEFYFSTKSQKKNLFYKTEPGVYLMAACIKNNKKKELLIFNEFYGGNDGREDIYGVFDPNIKKMLIKPTNSSKGNIMAVEKLLGYPPPFLNEDDGISFCCFKHHYQNND